MSERHEWLDAAAAYALDALDADERLRFEEHLAECAICRGEVAELRATAGSLAFAAPEVRPPSALRQRILDEAAAAQSEADRADTSIAETPHRLTRWLLAAASVAAIAAGAGYWFERQARLDLGAELDGARQQLTETQLEVGRQGALLDALLDADIVTATLTATDAAPSARLYWNRRQDVAVLTAFNLVAAPAGRTYQVWGIDTVAGTAPVSLGTFDPGDTQRAALSFAMPAGATFDLAAVTDEPAGGSLQPTTTPFLVGGFSDN